MQCIAGVYLKITLRSLLLYYGTLWKIRRLTDPTCACVERGKGGMEIGKGRQESRVRRCSQKLYFRVEIVHGIFRIL